MLGWVLPLRGWNEPTGDPPNRCSVEKSSFRVTSLRSHRIEEWT